MLPTVRLLLKVALEVSLSALRVPFTITLPSKVSTTKELKSPVPTEVWDCVAEPLYTLVPALSALLSVTVIRSFGLINPSEEFAITCAATF